MRLWVGALLGLAWNPGGQRDDMSRLLSSVCVQRGSSASQRGQCLSGPFPAFPVASQHREEYIVGEVPELVEETFPEQPLSLEP